MTFGLTAGAPLCVSDPPLLCQVTGCPPDGVDPKVTRGGGFLSRDLNSTRGKPMQHLSSSFWTCVTGTASFLEFSGERVISILIPSNPEDTHHAL